MAVTERLPYQSFLSYLQFEKRYSYHTVLAYERDLQAFADFLAANFDVSTVAAIQPALVRSWLASMKDAGLTAKTINRKISTLKSFFRFQLREGAVVSSPMTTVVSPKVSKRLPVYVEQKDLQQLLEVLPFPEGWDGILHKMTLLLLYSTGMRLSELVQLKVVQVDVSLRHIRILGKGNKERIIPMGAALVDAVSAYLLKRSEVSGAAVAPAFLVREGGKPLYPRYVQLLVHRYLSQVTTVEKRSPHVLRHSFATHLLNNGAELNAVKELLGHSSLAATQVYTHNTIEKLKEVHRRAHPKS